MPSAPPKDAIIIQRELGLGSAAAAVAGEAIAVGIFLTPAGMAKSLGSPFWLLAVWLIVGAMTLSGALCYGELAARYPRSGGSYVYLQECFGSRVAFLYGWMCLLVLDPGLTAALATGTASYTAYIFHWSPAATKYIAISVVLSLALLNAFSTKVSASFLRRLTWMKVGVLLVVTVWAFLFRVGHWSNFIPFFAQRSGSPPLLPALGGAMVGAFFSFGGWWDVTKISGEVRDPEKTMPRAMLLGVLIVTAVYVLVSMVFVYLVPLENVTSDETFVAQAGEVLFGALGGRILAAVVVLCVLGSLGVFMICAPRVYHAMANDGLFLSAVAKTHPRFGTPARAIAVQAAIASLLIALGTFQQIIAYFIFVAVFFLGLTVLGLFVSRRRAPESIFNLQTPPHRAAASVFLTLVLLLLVLLLARSPRQPALGCLAVLAGLPLYQFVCRKEEGSGAQAPAQKAGAQ
jgi:APA family basic amino acid/polyamine antiporter